MLRNRWPECFGMAGRNRPDPVAGLERKTQARDEGASDEAIIRTLTRGVPRGLGLDEVAKQWAAVLGLSVKEFKRIANVK